MIYFKRKSLWKRVVFKLRGIELPSLGLFSAFFKCSFALIIILLVFLYSSYLFLLPKYFTDLKVEGYINNYLKAHSKLSLNIDNLKISPDYKFDIKLNADKLALTFPNGSNFISLEKPEIEVDLFTLFFNYIDLNKIKTKKITINTNFTKNNHYNCFDYIDLDILDFKDTKFSLRNIKVICDEFIFNLFDENVKKNYKIHANKLAFSMSDTQKPVIIQTRGTVSDNKIISDFKLDLEIEKGKIFLDNLKTKIASLNYNPLIQASKYKFYTKSDVDLKVKNNIISGKIDLSDLNFVINNIQIPKNNLTLIFKDQKIKASGDFNLIKNQFIKFNLLANYSKNKYIEAKINSSEINLKDLKMIASSLSKILNLKYNLDLIDVEGEANADIYVKSNFKTIVSSGYTHIKNAKIKDSSTGLVLNEINSSISFDNSRINIQNASALFDNSKFHLNGIIDSNTNLNLKINSDLINIAQILGTIRHLPLLSHMLPELNDYIFESGFVKVNADVNGTLNMPVIKTNSLITDFKLKINSLKTIVKSQEIKISANPEGTTIKDVQITAKNNIIECLNNKIYSANAKLKMAENDILIDRTQITYDKIKANIQGIIRNYKKDSYLELNLSAPLPVNNNIIVVKNKSPNLSADILLDKNKLLIKNAKIYEGSKNLILINGYIYDFLSNNLKFENLKVLMNERISCILPKFDNINFDATADLIVSGTISNPVISGSAKLYDVICKKYNLFIQNCDLNIKNSAIEGKIATLNALETVLTDVIFKGNLSNDNLNVTNFSAEIFQGKISGNASINIKNLKVNTELILKEISIRHISNYLKEYSIAASGRLSALCNLNFSGLDYESALKSLEGYVKFNIDNGELSQFAKLERFLQAGNILSQSILKLTINSIVSSVTKQNTGDFKTIEGTVKINSPMAQIQYINTQGTNMSLHIEGRYNIINNHAILRVLGRIPQNIVNIMGNVGKFSFSQLMDKQPAQSAIEKMMSVYMSDEDRAKIPELVNYQPSALTREFIVIIDGLLNNNSSVKYFKWGYKN